MIYEKELLELKQILKNTTMVVHKLDEMGYDWISESARKLCDELKALIPHDI